MTHVTDPELKPAAIHVYAALREALDDYDISPSKAELARACNVSVTTVMQSVAALRRKGYIHAPKHQIRALRPTDPERTISREPPDPWAELAEPRKYFKGVVHR